MICDQEFTIEQQFELLVLARCIDDDYPNLTMPKRIAKARCSMARKRIKSLLKLTGEDFYIRFDDGETLWAEDVIAGLGVVLSDPRVDGKEIIQVLFRGMQMAFLLENFTDLNSAPP